MTPLPQREIVEFLYGVSGSAPSFFLFFDFYFNDSKIESQRFRNLTGKKLHFRVELTAEYTYASDTCKFGFCAAAQKKCRVTEPGDIPVSSSRRTVVGKLRINLARLQCRPD